MRRDNFGLAKDFSEYLKGFAYFEALYIYTNKMAPLKVRFFWNWSYMVYKNREFNVSVQWILRWSIVGYLPRTVVLDIIFFSRFFIFLKTLFHFLSVLPNLYKISGGNAKCSEQHCTKSIGGNWPWSYCQWYPTSISVIPISEKNISDWKLSFPYQKCLDIDIRVHSDIQISKFF